MKLESGVGSYWFGYQGQYAERDDETNWNSFELRMYDARIGRWLGVDPAGQYSSPYVGMGNNPVSRVDPNGGFDTKAGAWLWKLFNGGGDISYDKENGTYQVAQTYKTQFEGQELIGVSFTVGRSGNKWDSFHKRMTAFDRGGGADGANTGAGKADAYSVNLNGQEGNINASLSISVVPRDGIGIHFTGNSASLLPGRGLSLTLTQYVFTNKDEALVGNLNGCTAVFGGSLLYLTGSYGTSLNPNGSVLYKAYEYGYGYGSLNKLVPSNKVTNTFNISGGLPSTFTMQLGYFPFKK